MAADRERAWSQALGIWVGRHGEAMRTIRELEDENDALRAALDKIKCCKGECGICLAHRT